MCHKQVIHSYHSTTRNYKLNSTITSKILIFCTKKYIYRKVQCIRFPTLRTSCQTDTWNSRCECINFSENANTDVIPQQTLTVQNLITHQLNLVPETWNLFYKKLHCISFPHVQTGRQTYVQIKSYNQNIGRFQSVAVFIVTGFSSKIFFSSPNQCQFDPNSLLQII